MRAGFLAFFAILVLALPGCGYNSLTRQDEDVKAAWADVANQYQRRADLIPNLVRTVKGYANQEQQVLIGVTEARARQAGSIQLTPELLNDPAAFAKFQAAQNQLTASLKSLIAVAEAYPELKSNENFRDLQAQLEGTENRITIARQRYIETVRSYNTTVRSFPTNLTAKVFDFQLKPNFTANEQAMEGPPTVDFTAPPAPSGAGPGATQSPPGSSASAPPTSQPPPK